MNRQPVKSSNLVSAGYVAGVLEIEFRGGKIYRYDGVPVEVYVGLTVADSAGKFFAQHIQPAYIGVMVQ